MKVGSLFTGYGGLDMAVGGDLAWYAEVEPAACKVLAAHYPGVPNLGDVTAVDWSAVEPVDVITGGYPCQPFSTAGKRKGKDDDRHLWPYVRDAIGAIRPRWAVLENVRGHLTLGFADVLADLADLGVSARWGVVRAADAGAPHNRARLFIVANANGEGLQGRAEQQVRAGRVEPLGDDVANAASAERRAAESNDLPQTQRPAKLGERAGHAADTNQQRLQHASIRVDDGSRQAAVEGHPRSAANASRERHGCGERPTGVGRVGSPPESSGWSASTAWQEPGAGSVARWGQYAPAIERWQHVLGRPAPAPTIQRNDRDRLNPAFVEWMMGLPEGHVTGHGLSPSAELKMLGNGVVPQQARLALNLLGAM